MKRYIAPIMTHGIKPTFWWVCLSKPVGLPDTLVALALVAAEALSRADDTARRAGLEISWIEHDLDRGLPRRLPDYDLIVVMRYLDLSLVQAAAQRLRPGGYLLCEVHMISDEPVIGPRDANFRARPGELRAVGAGLDAEARQLAERRGQQALRAGGRPDPPDLAPVRAAVRRPPQPAPPQGERRGSRSGRHYAAHRRV